MIYDLGDRRVGADDEAWVASTAAVIGDVRLGRNSSVWFGAVVRADHGTIVIGDESNIQDGAVLHCDEGRTLTIGRRVTVGHGAVLHGCTVGDGSLIGIHATVLNGAVIGKECLVGAGSLVLEKTVIPDRMLVLGAPARAVRPLRDEEIEEILDAAEHYVRNAAFFRGALTPRP